MVVRAAHSLEPERLAEPLLDFTCSLPDFSPEHWPNLRVAEYNGLLDHLEGFDAAWDPWEPGTRAEVAQILWDLVSAD